MKQGESADLYLIKYKKTYICIEIGTKVKKRLLFNDLERYVDHKNALVVTGMRQVGKTTLMRQVYDQIAGPKLWFDFENPLDTLYFEDQDYSNSYQSLCLKAGVKEERLHVFIDEVQHFPEITQIVKYHIDHFGVKYYLTGSSNFYLKNLFPESLSGRKFLFQLHPLSFNEYLYFTDRKEKLLETSDLDNLLKSSNHYKDFIEFEAEYQDYLSYGGFPEVCLTQNQDTKLLVLRNIFSSFFEKDLAVLSDLQDIRELRNLILLLAPRAGNLLDVTRIASELGVQRTKVYQYLEFLQGVFFLDLLPKYSKSIDRSVAGGRKVYFADNGLLQVAGQVSQGQLLENSVSNQLKPYGEVSFYPKKNAAEIDFIVNKQVAFEVKTQGTDRDTQKLKRLADKLDLSNYRVVSQKYFEHEKALFPQMI